MTIALHNRHWPDHMIDLRDIKFIDQSRSKEGRVGNTRRVQLKDGEWMEMSDHEVERIALRPSQLIPAEPGTAVINLFTDSATGKRDVFRTPLIAWALCLDGEVRPVTAEGVNDDQSDSNFAILLATGQVTEMGCATYDSVEKYIVAQEERAGAK